MIVGSRNRLAYVIGITLRPVDQYCPVPPSIDFYFLTFFEAL